MKRIFNPTIDVTRNIIDRSTPELSGRCMVAQAVRLGIPGAASVHVTAETISFNVEDTRYMFPTPPDVSLRVINFDDISASKGVEAARAETDPFSFRLYAASCYERPVHRKGPRTSPVKKHKPHRPTPRRCVRRYMGLKVIVSP